MFLDDVCAWKFGPVVPDVYYKFCPYAGRAINMTYRTEIESGDQELMNDVINNYIDEPVNILVKRTHLKGSAWNTVYQGGTGRRKVIPFELIIEMEGA